MDSSLFCFTTDLADEGVETVLRNATERAGVNSLTAALLYHEARDVFPHNPKRKVIYTPGGSTHYQPDQANFEGTDIQPIVGAGASEGAIPALLEAASARGVDVRAWVVFMHADGAGFANPSYTSQNCFGDHYLTDFCPSNPAVRDYAKRICRDISSLGVKSIMAESLHFHAFEHGTHHERQFVPLGPREKFLLGLCFCPHCVSRGTEAGVDVEGLRLFATTVVTDCLGSGRVTELAQGEIAEIAGGDLRSYLDMRKETVRSLFDECRSSMVGDTQLSYIDLSGAYGALGEEAPAGQPAWGDVFAAAPASLDGAADEILLLGYGPDPASVDKGVRHHADATKESRVAVAFRPMAPDCDGPDNLKSKVAKARDAGLDRIDFYHYGFMGLEALDWIAASLSG